MTSRSLVLAKNSSTALRYVQRSRYNDHDHAFTASSISGRTYFLPPSSNSCVQTICLFPSSLARCHGFTSRFLSASIATLIKPKSSLAKSSSTRTSFRTTRTISRIFFFLFVCVSLTLPLFKHMLMSAPISAVQAASVANQLKISLNVVRSI